MKHNVILIGFMGAGKTTIGKKIANRMNYPLLDTDQLIEEKAGMSISELFESQGEEAFRTIEAEMLQELKGCNTNSVISVGGGLPLREENRHILKKLGIVIYLEVSKETVLKRLEGDKTRPLLMVGDVEGKVGSLLTIRDPIYKMAADATVNANGKGFQKVLEEIDEIISTKWAKS